MFEREYIYFKAKRRSAEEGRRAIQANQNTLWRTDEAGEQGIGIPGRCVFAQNDSYLEVCNPGLERNWLAVLISLITLAVAIFFVWGWYGFAVQPLFTGTMAFLWTDLGPSRTPMLWFGWLLVFPLMLVVIYVAYGMHRYLGGATAFFTFTRGRIRFNRVTRKVYVLRPENCGGNVVLDWSSLRAIVDAAPYDLLMRRSLPKGQGNPAVLILYRANETNANGDDAIFVGPNVVIGNTQVARFWEYIRNYMEVGPSVDRIPPDVPEDYSCVPRYLPHNYSTFCGPLSAAQYRLEQRPGFGENLFFQLSQLTCRWPRFPKEWASDSGMGEPEDRPVQTGAVMTAMVYRALGKLSAADETEFLKGWGTPDALAEVKARASA